MVVGSPDQGSHDGRGDGMPMHALRLTGTRTEPRWLRGERTRTQADAPLSAMQDDTNRWVLRMMEVSLHLHNALPHIADAGAAEHARAAVTALDDMIKTLRSRSLPGDRADYA